jgi:hypothetical protein
MANLRAAAPHAIQLPRDRPVSDVSFRALDFEVNAGVGNVGAVFWKQIAATDHILQRNADEPVFQRDQLSAWPS